MNINKYVALDTLLHYAEEDRLFSLADTVGITLRHLFLVSSLQRDGLNEVKYRRALLQIHPQSPCQRTEELFHPIVQFSRYARGTHSHGQQLHKSPVVRKSEFLDVKIFHAGATGTSGNLRQQSYSSIDGLWFDHGLRSMALSYKFYQRMDSE